MNFKYIYPLFKRGEEEQALDYLSNDMILKRKRCSTENELEIDEDEDTDQEIYDISKDLFRLSYGVNITLMANYSLVESTFNEIYKPSIIKYLTYAGVNAKYLEIKAGSIVFSTILHRSNSKDFKPLKRLNPNEKWNKEMLSYLPYRSTNLTNPLNNWSHVFLSIEKPDIDKNFREEIVLSGSDCFYNDNSIFVKMIPSPDYESIFNITQAIHKYF